jgi:hypothetical protein
MNDFAKGDLIQRLSGCGFLALTLEGFDPIIPKAFNKVLPPALYFVVAEKFANKSYSK